MSDKKKKSTVDLTIKPIKNFGQTEDKPLPNPMFEKFIIPNHASRVYFCGKSGSGKSTALINLLTMNKYYFDEIHIFSPTIGDDQNWKNYLDIYTKKEKMIETYDDLDLNAITNILASSQEDINENGLRHGQRKLIIIDDLIDSKNMRQEAMKSLFFKSRHWSVSVYISSQSYMEMPRALRVNCSNLLIFKPDNSEIKRIVEEQANLYIKDKKDLEHIIQDACFSEKNSFLHINKQSDPQFWYRKTLKYIYMLKK